MPLKDLIIEDIVAGTGPAVKAGDPVSVHYTGRLEDGTVFDSSEGRDPLDFTCGIGLVIPGWDQGLIGLKKGGKRRLSIPAVLPTAKWVIRALFRPTPIFIRRRAGRNRLNERRRRNAVTCEKFRRLANGEPHDAGVAPRD